MSGVGVLGLLWAAVGIWWGSRWWRDRGPVPAPAAPALGRSRFGRAAAGGAWRRRQAMRLAYAAGAASVAGGLLLGWAWILALGAALVNLGTLYRHLVLLLDEAPEPDGPLPARAPSPGCSPRRAVLAGNLAD
jgi:hypothetical protein